MGGIDDTHGDLPVILEIWALDAVPEDSLFRALHNDRKDVAYLLSSRFIRTAVLRTTLGDRTLEFAHREHSPLDRRDLGLRTEPVPVADIEQLITRPKKAVFDLELSFVFFTFLRLTLRGMTGSQGESLSADAGALPTEFESAMPPVDPDTDEVRLESPPTREVARNLKVRVESVTVTPTTDAPEVRVRVILDLRVSGLETLTEDLLATLWSDLVATEEREVRRFVPHVARLRESMSSYFAANIPLARGAQALESLVATTAGQTYPAAIENMRNALDKRLIVANYWAALTEDPGLEKHHANVSATMGSITGTRPWASVVYLLRSAFGDIGLPGDLNLLGQAQPPVDAAASVTAQEQVFLSAGVGHCGEHSQIAFEMMRQAIERNAVAGLTSAVLVGSLDEDHGFALANVVPSQDTIKQGFHPASQQQVALLDLSRVLEEHVGVLPPEILDAYLQPSATAASLQDYVTRQQAHRGHADVIFRAATTPKSP